jgi:hypothetical protein
MGFKNNKKYKEILLDMLKNDTLPNINGETDEQYYNDILKINEYYKNSQMKNIESNIVLALPDNN